MNRAATPGALGLGEVIAFTYPPNNFDTKTLRSVTLLGPGRADEWKYWQARGVATGVGHTWFDLLRAPVEQAARTLAGLDYGGNPHPLLMIDEFGFDFGGEMDEKAARILRQTRLEKPGLALAVFEMRGPMPPVLAEAYRDAADLVMLESYVDNSRHYWWLAAQAWAARQFGLLPKTIMVLGVGKGGNPGEHWAETPQELEQQIRFVRLIAPESPGVGFFGGTPELLARADALCAGFSATPQDGAGLPDDAQALVRSFMSRHAKPALVVSPSFVQPNYDSSGSGKLVQPPRMRAYLINLGDQDAHGVRLRLRNPPEAGGEVFAEGEAPLVPARSVAIGVLRITGLWRVWVGQWVLEVEAPGAEVITYKW